MLRVILTGLVCCGLTAGGAEADTLRPFGAALFTKSCHEITSLCITPETGKGYALWLYYTSHFWNLQEKE